MINNNQEKGCTFNEDYISRLHDSLIHHIISCLSIRDVVKCCTLSRRWKYVWTTLPNLNWDDLHHPSHSISSFVDNLKNSYSSPKLKKLHLNMSSIHGHGLTLRISECLEFAIERQVEDVSLVFQDEIVEGKEDFVLPKIFYNDHSNSLQNVYLRRCSIHSSMGNNINWPSLKTLSIEKAPLSDAEISTVLVGYPFLESLTLTNCWGMNCIKLSSKSLKEFIIAGYDIVPNAIETKIHEDEGEGEGEDEDEDGDQGGGYDYNSEPWEFYDSDDRSYSSDNDYDDDFLDPDIPTMEINAPYLRSLHIKGSWYKKIVKSVQAASLVEAELRFIAVGYDGVHSFMLRQLYKNLRDVSDLIIATVNFEELLCEKCFVYGPPLFSVEMLGNDRWHLKKLPFTTTKDDQSIQCGSN